MSRLSNIKPVPAGITLLFVAGLYLYVTSDSGDSQTSSENSQDYAVGEGTYKGDPERFSKTVKSGDADTSADTIRKLDQHALAAKELAKNAMAEVERNKKHVSEQMDEMKAGIQNNETLADLQTKMVTVVDTLSTLTDSEKQKGRNYVTPNLRESEWITVPTIGGAQETYVNQGNAATGGRLLANSINDEPEAESLIKPVATIPANSALLNGITLSTLIGRVPRGSSLQTPFSFYVVTSNDNLASQGHQIPYLKEAIWRGVAFGDKDLQCVRGRIQSVTFVYEDATIQTIPESPQGQFTTDLDSDNYLGEIVTPRGNNCLPGKLVSNTAKYIAWASGAGALSGLGQVAGRGNSVTSFNGQNSISEIASSSNRNFAIGRGISTGADITANIINQEYANSFASVVIPSGQLINIMSFSQLELNHNPDARKVRYEN